MAIFLLAGLMSVGCLFACGDGGNNDNTDNDTGAGSGNGGGNQNGEVVVGTQVTQDQWYMAFANTDYTNVVVTGMYTEKAGDESCTETENAVFTPTTYYEEYLWVEKEGTTTVDQGSEKYWEHVANGTLYSYETETEDGETETNDWAMETYSLERFDMEDFGYYWTDVFSEDVLLQDLSAYTFNNAKGVYRREKSTMMNGGTYNGWVEVLISNSKVYSVEYAMNYTGTFNGVAMSASVSTKAVFKSQAITLPSQNTLNALIANSGNTNQGGDVNTATLVGTYSFKSFEAEDGTVYEVGDSLFGLELTEDFIVIALDVDGVAYVSSFGELKSGKWEQNGNVITVTMEGDPARFNWSNGELLSMEEKWTVKKSSNAVNPDDFNVGGGNTEQGGTNKPESGDNERPGDDNTGEGVSDEFLLGTYKFYSQTVGGETSSVENGMSEDYISIGINPDHTMYYSIMKNEALILDWEMVGDELQCSTGGTIIMTFEIVGAELVMRTGNDIMTLVKKSNTVNPDDFNLGESGGLGGDSIVAKVVGEYNFYRLDMYEGETYYVGDYFSNMNRLTETYYHFIVNKDGTATVIWQDYDMGLCNWYVENEEIVITLENGAVLTRCHFEDEYLVEEEAYSYKAFLTKKA